MNEQKEQYSNLLTNFGFEEFFKSEIAKFTPKEREAYEDSLKYYRDIKNVVDTSKQEGKVEVAIELKRNNVPINIISKSTGLTEEEIESL